jgi:hypothetical protein
MVCFRQYEACVRRQSALDDPELLLFLARAHYLSGDMKHAKMVLAKVCGALVFVTVQPSSSAHRVSNRVLRVNFRVRQRIFLLTSVAFTGPSLASQQRPVLVQPRDCVGAQRHHYPSAPQIRTIS